MRQIRMQQRWVFQKSTPHEVRSGWRCYASCGWFHYDRYIYDHEGD